MKILSIFLISLYSFILADTSIVGTWGISAGERTYAFTFTADGKYLVDFGGDGKIDVYGTYSVSQNQVTIKDTNGDMACRGDKGGTYQYAVSGNQITFTMVNDDCNFRLSLNGQTLNRM